MNMVLLVSCICVLQMLQHNRNISLYVSCYINRIRSYHRTCESLQKVFSHGEYNMNTY